MATAEVNGVRLYYEIEGDGDVPLVMVHGAWTSHIGWRLVVPELARDFRVLTYDQRGHSDSERPSGQTTVHDHVADLAALIEHTGGQTPATAASRHLLTPATSPRTPAPAPRTPSPQTPPGH